MFAISTLRKEGELFSRTVGLFETEAEAVRVLDKNVCDLNEAGYYSLAVIEEIDYRLYPIPKLIRAYVWDDASSQWKYSKKIPEDIKKHLEQFSGFVSVG